MKNKNLLSFVIFSILFFSTFMNVYSQCPGCAISMTCTATPAKPAICPDTLPQGTAMQPYSEDISFYLPGTFVDEGSGYTVDLDQMQVLNIIGMPLGLSWQTNKSPSNIYSPHGNVNDQHGCAKICGTPYSAGDYIVTVFVKADVSVVSLGGIAQTSNTSFEIPIKILPGSSSNNSFSISNPFGCAPLSTSFISTNPSNGNTNFHYAWDFGNGNQSSLEAPPSQNYTTPGNYVINLTTTIDTLSYYLTSVSVNSATGCNDSPWSSPDYYFNLIKNGVTLYNAPYIDNTDPPVSFSFSPIKLANATYLIDVYDWDNGYA
jgi:PKD repeat protein